MQTREKSVAFFVATPATSADLVKYRAARLIISRLWPIIIRHVQFLTQTFYFHRRQRHEDEHYLCKCLLLNIPNDFIDIKTTL